MADNRNEIYDDESEGKGFYKKDRGVKKDAEARQGSLEEAENEAVSAASDEKLTQDEAEAGGFSYTSGNSSSSGSSNGNLKKGLLGGGIIASLAGLVVSLFVSFLPLKMEFIIQNITRSVTAATYETIENRFERVLEKYMTRRIFTDYAGDRPYDGNTIFGKLFNTWRGGRFEDKLFRDYGLRFEGLVGDGNGGWTRAPNNVRPAAWRVVTSEITSNVIQDTNIDLSRLDNVLRGSDTRRVIRQVTREATAWNQVLKRRHVRRLLMNKFDVPDWKVPDSLNDTRSNYSQRKVAAKKWLIRRAVGPFSARYAAFFSCILDSNTCGDILKQSDPDLDGSVPDGDPRPNEPDRSDYCLSSPCATDPVTGELIIDEDAYNADLAQYADDLAQWQGENAINDLADTDGSQLTDDVVDTVDSPDAPGDGSSLDNVLSRFVSRKMMQTVFAAAGLVGLIDILSEINGALESGAISKALYDMKMMNYVSDAVPILTANSQLLAGEMTAEGAGVLFEQLEGFEEHPIFAAEYGTLQDFALIGGGAVYAQGTTIAYDCDDDPATADEVLSLDSPVCEHEKIYKDYEEFTDSSGYEAFSAVISVYDATLKPFVEFFGSIIDWFLGPIIQTIMDWFDVGPLIAKGFEFVGRLLVGPTCTGVDAGGAKYNCIRGGLEAAYAQTGEEGVNGIGGEYLSDDEWRFLSQRYHQQIAWEWQQEPLLTRLFSTDSSQSLLASAIVNTPDSIEDTSRSIASVLTNPVRNFGSIFSNLSGRVNADTRTGYNPYGIVHYGYVAGDPAIQADPEEDPMFSDCEVEITPSQYLAKYESANPPRTLAQSTKPGAPRFAVWTDTDPCSLERTVAELGGALFGDESGGVGYDYYEGGGAEFYAGEIDEVFGVQNYAGASW